jgi:hypothetical protein
MHDGAPPLPYLAGLPTARRARGETAAVREDKPDLTTATK